jgi:hypothetical protein
MHTQSDQMAQLRLQAEELLSETRAALGITDNSEREVRPSPPPISVMILVWQKGSRYARCLSACAKKANSCLPKPGTHATEPERFCCGHKRSCCGRNRSAGNAESRIPNLENRSGGSRL